jgi:hypothetical protein
MSEIKRDMESAVDQTSIPTPAAKADEDQIIYANLLAKGMYLGLGIMLVTFALYLTGFIRPGIPIEALPDLWTLSVHEYLEVVNHEYLHQPQVVDGWQWVALLGMSDFLNFVPIALLAAITILCYLRILPNLLRKKDWIYFSIAAVEVVVLVLAASGKVSGGH